MSIHYNPSYRRTFGGSWNGLAKDKIVVFEAPDGRVEYPGRADAPMPLRYQRAGFVRRELAPFEVSAFEKKNGVICESLHWDNNGKVDRESIPDRPQVKDFSYQELMQSE